MKNYFLPGIAAVLLTGVIMVLPIEYLLRFFLDDSYFYLKTAWNASLGFGSTFDRIDYTNGYHPLWFALLTAWYYIVQLTGEVLPELLLRLTFVLVVIINFGTVKLLIPLFNRLSPDKDNNFSLPLLALIIVLPLFFVVGLEQQLLIFWLTLYMYIECRSESSSQLLKSILLALIVLTRTDMIIYLIPALILYQIRNYSLRNKIVTAVRLLIIPISLYALYLLLNYVLFGSISTISSKIEFIPGWPLIIYHFPLPWDNPIRFSFIVLIFCSAVWYWVAGRRLFSYGKLSDIKILFDYLIIFTFFYMIVHFSFNKNGMREWYYLVPLYISILLFLPAVKIFFETAKLRIGLAVFILLFFFGFFRLYYYDASDAYNYAKMVNRKTNSGDVIYMYDYSGLFSFFSGRKVINGDGLINSFYYLDVINSGRLRFYLDSVGVDYFSTYTYDKIDRRNDYSDKFRNDGTKFAFPADDLILQSEKVHGGIFRKKYGWFLLFKYTGNSE